MAWGDLMVRKWAFRGALVALVFAAVGCKVSITPSAPGSWFFFNEGANGTGHFTNGPGTPPDGNGSALLTVDGTGREAIATLKYQGTALSTITNLQYSTYQAFSGSPNETPNLEFDIDYDSTDATTAYQGRLVYVPASGGTITPNAWQTWNTLTGSPGGAWYSSASGGSSFRPIVGGVTQTPICTQASYCSWTQVLAAYPHAQIRPTTGLFMARIGGPITNGWSGAVDDITVGIGGHDSTYNFEADSGATVIDSSNAAARDFGFAQETPTGSGAFVSGPTGADGTGSAQLTVDATGGEGITTGVFAGTRIDRFTALSYETYEPSATTNAPTLQFDTDYDSTDASTAFQGRLVFEPSQSGTAVATGTWQTWNPLTATSGWWQTGNAIVGGVNVGQQCTQASPCSFATILADYPDASVRPDVGQNFGIANTGHLWLKAGGGWAPGFTGNVDDLTVGIDSVNVTYNFEP
jgi:hypothetical protein